MAARKPASSAIYQTATARLAGDIVIDPFNPEYVNPNSYDLRLGSKLLVFETRPMVCIKDDKRRCVACARKQVRPKSSWQRSPQWRNVAAQVYHELEPWRDILDMARENPVKELSIPTRGIVLVPGRLYLGHTMEYTETHTLVPCIEGRSSIGRLGIQIHSTAGFGDVGFKGTWTLEISVVEPVRIYAGVRFCQIHFETVEGEYHKYESTKYQGQREPRPSGLWKEFQTPTS